jgi:hypothetical protein
MESNIWIRYKEEIGPLQKGKGVVRFMKSERLRWFGHAERIEDNARPKKVIIKETGYQKKRRKTQDEMVRRCRELPK